MKIRHPLIQLLSRQLCCQEMVVGGGFYLAEKMGEVYEAYDMEVEERAEAEVL